MTYRRCSTNDRSETQQHEAMSRIAIEVHSLQQVVSTHARLQTIHTLPPSGALPSPWLIFGSPRGDAPYTDKIVSKATVKGLSVGGPCQRMTLRVGAAGCAIDFRLELVNNLSEIRMMVNVCPKHSNYALTCSRGRIS